MLPGLDLVDVWAAGRAGAPASGAEALLSRLGSDVEAMTPGGRDRALLELYASSFGPSLDAVATCPRCGELLDVAVRIDELVATLPSPGATREVRLADGGHEVRVEFRLPTVADLHAAPRDGAALLDACVTRAVIDGGEIAPSVLPPAVRAAVEVAMEDGDPYADIALLLACPACDHGWDERFDPALFVWTELGHAARRLVADVADLASAFGWNERDVLAMSPARRHLYLEVVRAS